MSRLLMVDGGPPAMAPSVEPLSPELRPVAVAPLECPPLKWNPAPAVVNLGGRGRTAGGRLRCVPRFEVRGGGSGWIMWIFGFITCYFSKARLTDLGKALTVSRPVCCPHLARNPHRVQLALVVDYRDRMFRLISGTPGWNV